ncbi:TonB-dependent receptor [Niabella defluvii]|nr:TonB-dependent receptor [Niabella sp. I65]
MDLGFWRNRLSLSIDAYYKKTTDLLLNVEIPWTTGYASSLQNFGSVENKGLELGLKSKNIAGHFVWNSDLNISFNRNKVAKIGNNAQSYVSGNYIIQVGKPLGTFYGTVTDGILQTGEETQKGKFTGNATPKAGDRLYKDINGDGTFTTAADRTIIGNAQPDFIFGFINTFSWRGFDLSVFLQGTYGNQIINSNRQTLEMFTGQQNASVIALERWTSQNPSATIPGRNWILHLSSPTGLLKMVPFCV